MADAVIKVSQTTIMVPKTVNVPTINLELTIEEAITLATLLANVMGATEKSPRRYTGEVLRALSKLGISWISPGIRGDSIDFAPDVYKAINESADRFRSREV